FFMHHPDSRQPTRPFLEHWQRKTSKNPSSPGHQNQKTESAHKGSVSVVPICVIRAIRGKKTPSSQSMFSVQGWMFDVSVLRSSFIPVCVFSPSSAVQTPSLFPRPHSC